MVLLGIDPSTCCTGYGVIKKAKHKTQLIDYGCLELKPKIPIVDRIGGFYEFFTDKIKEHKITHLAIEIPFCGKNSAVFGKLSYIRGVLYLLAYKYRLSIMEYAPCRIKEQITGYGSATKEQVANIVVKFFPGIKMPLKDDITDALSVCMCALWEKNPSNVFVPRSNG